jgi:hypothetical protein
MDDIREVGVEDTRSKNRYTVITLVEGIMHYHEGYLTYHDWGEVRVRANTAAMARQLHLYAWDKVIAFIPMNKSVKKIWLHPHMEDILPKLDTRTHYYNKYYQQRIAECLESSQQT